MSKPLVVRSLRLLAAGVVLAFAAVGVYQTLPLAVEAVSSRREPPPTPAEREAPGATRVLCVGDSYTYGFGVTGEQAYPRRLEGRLSQALPGRAVRVYNLGVPSMSSSQARRAAEEAFDDYQPGVILFLAGVNNTWNFQDSSVFEDAALANLARAEGIDPEWEAKFTRVRVARLYRLLTRGLSAGAGANGVGGAAPDAAHAAGDVMADELAREGRPREFAQRLEQANGVPAAPPLRQARPIPPRLLALAGPEADEQARREAALVAGFAPSDNERAALAAAAPEIEVARVHAAAGEVEAAVAGFRAMLARVPGALAPRLFALETLLAAGREDDARRFAEESLGAAPHLFPVPVRLARHFNEAGRYEACAEILAPLVARFPGAWDLRLLYGVALHQLGRFGPARDALAEAVAQNDLLCEGHDCLARALIHLGEFDAAFLTVQRYRALLPASPRGPLLLGFLEFRRGNLLVAEQQLGDALLRHPDLTEAHWYLAETLVQAGKPERAREEAVAGFETTGDLDRLVRVVGSSLSHDADRVRAELARIDADLTARFPDAWKSEWLAPVRTAGRALAARILAHDLARLATLARERGSRLVVLDYPTTAFGALNNDIRAAATENHLEWIALENEFKRLDQYMRIGGLYFRDGHLTASGCDHMADVIARNLLQRELLR
ncbi:MAG: hypothetical protein HY719_16715 [Planctomycetes bacterium]|nr:hypothetical protein [Planctomycetota bacterium]